MKLLKRIICIFKGHKWRKHLQIGYIDPFDLDDAIEEKYYVTKCACCGKIKEEQI